MKPSHLFYLFIFPSGGKGVKFGANILANKIFVIPVSYYNVAAWIAVLVLNDNCEHLANCKAETDTRCK